MEATGILPAHFTGEGEEKEREGESSQSQSTWEPGEEISLAPSAPPPTLLGAQDCSCCWWGEGLLSRGRELHLHGKAESRQNVAGWTGPRTTLRPFLSVD